MKKVLITGVTGFAGSHLAELLVSQKQYEVFGTNISDRNFSNIDSIKDTLQLFTANLMDFSQTDAVIKEVKPDIIFHLAASTFVADSFNKPAEFITNNVSSQVNLLESVRRNALQETKIIVVSSSHIYGYVLPEDIPIDERTPMRPDNPYSVSKIAQDYLGLSYFLAYKLPIIIIRPFNHIGPRLSPQISISRWAKMIAEIEKGESEPILRVGNLETKRDFTDVRDMVRAYVLAAEQCIPGEAYNVGTGTAHIMEDMLKKLVSFSTKDITIQTDPSLFRPSDIPELRADATKFRNTTGWKSEIPLEKSLQDTLEYWRKVV